jgi:hypothetical protein
MPLPEDAEGLTLADLLRDRGRSVPVPVRTLGGRRMQGARPMTPQEEQMADNPAIQMGRDAGALASRGINSAGMGLPGLMLDYASPDTLAAILRNEELANPGVTAIGSAAGVIPGLAPKAAMTALGGAYGLAGAADLGAFDSSAEAQAKKGGTSLPGLAPDQMAAYNAAEKKLAAGKFKNAADRRQTEDLLRDLREISKDFQKTENASKIGLKTDADKKKQGEYDRAVGYAESLRDKELARDRRFSDTNTGKVWEATGGLAPFFFGAATGGLSRAATGGGSAAKDYLLPGALGALGGASSANVPLAYNALFTEPDNPQRRAFDAYARELPPDHPRRQEFADYASKLPEANPVRTSASAEFYDPIKLAERAGMGGIEGFLGGMVGSDVARAAGGAPTLLGRLLRGPRGPQPGGATPGAGAGGTPSPAVPPSPAPIAGDPGGAGGLQGTIVENMPKLADRLKNYQGQLPAPAAVPNQRALKPLASEDGKEVVYRGKDRLGRTFHKDDDGLFTKNPRKKSDE